MTVLSGSHFAQICEGCKIGKELGHGFKSLGWISPRGEGEGEELRCPRHAAHARVLTLLVDSLRGLPPRFPFWLSVAFWHRGPDWGADNPPQISTSVCSRTGSRAASSRRRCPAPGDGVPRRSPSFSGSLLGASRKGSRNNGPCAKLPPTPGAAGGEGGSVVAALGLGEEEEGRAPMHMDRM